MPQMIFFDAIKIDKKDDFLQVEIEAQQ